MAEGSREYPRRGEHGDPRPRCEWCGRPGVRDGDEVYTWCSRDCRAALRYQSGGFLSSLCFGMSMIALLIFLIYNGVLDFIGILAYITSVIVVLVWLTRDLLIGREIVNAPTEEFEARIRLDDEELLKLTKKILQFVGENDSPSGVSQNSIIQSLKGEGYLGGSIKMAIDKLLVRGELVSIRLGRIGIGRVDPSSF